MTRVGMSSHACLTADVCVCELLPAICDDTTSIILWLWSLIPCVIFFSLLPLIIVIWPTSVDNRCLDSRMLPKNGASVWKIRILSFSIHLHSSQSLCACRLLTEYNVQNSISRPWRLATSHKRNTLCSQIGTNCEKMTTLNDRLKYFIHSHQGYSVFVVNSCLANWRV